MDSQEIVIHWTIATDPSYYGTEATEADVAAYAQREEREVAAYISERWPTATLEMEHVPESVSFGNRTYARVDGERYDEGDPLDILAALTNFVQSHWTDWLGDALRECAAGARPD